MTILRTFTAVAHIVLLHTEHWTMTCKIWVTVCKRLNSHIYTQYLEVQPVQACDICSDIYEYKKALWVFMLFKSSDGLHQDSFKNIKCHETHSVSDEEVISTSNVSQLSYIKNFTAPQHKTLCCASLQKLTLY